MSLLEDIVEAGWTHEPRTLAGGVAAAPSNAAEEIADAIWTYLERTLTSVELVPTTIIALPVTLRVNGTRQLAAMVYDQFDNPMSPQPSVEWELTGTPIGEITSEGFYTAPADPGTDTAWASSGDLEDEAEITILPIVASQGFVKFASGDGLGFD